MRGGRGPGPRAGGAGRRPVCRIGTESADMVELAEGPSGKSERFHPQAYGVPYVDLDENRQIIAGQNEWIKRGKSTDADLVICPSQLSKDGGASRAEDWSKGLCVPTCAENCRTLSANVA